MDRYEDKVREEEIMKLAGDRRYTEAAELADTIDWSRVRSVTTLCKISDVYKGARRFQESKEILLMAYKKYPENRRIVYALCLRSIQLEEYVQAIEYYKEFRQLAPNDTDRYILQYRIYEAQDVSLEERAAVLEEFKSKDYQPKWGYELAYLYHRMGLGTKCVDECEEFIATFGEGKYVIKAMELKALHEPLTDSEKLEYERYINERDLAIQSGAEPHKGVPESIQDMGNSTLEEEDLQGAPTAELPIEPEQLQPVEEKPAEPEPAEIEVKPVDVGQYNTINLQAALAESMKDIWGEDAQDQEDIAEPGRPAATAVDNSQSAVSEEDNIQPLTNPAAAVEVPVNASPAVQSPVYPATPAQEETANVAAPTAQAPVNSAPGPQPAAYEPEVSRARVERQNDTPAGKRLIHDTDTRLMPSTPQEGVEDITIFEPTPLAGRYMMPDSGVNAGMPGAGMPGADIPMHTPSTPEEGVEDNTIFTPTPLSGYRVSSEEILSEIAPQEPMIDLMPPPEPGISPVRELSPLLKPETPPQSNSVLIEQTKRIPTDTIVDYLETQKIVKEIQHSTASMQASTAQSEKIPGAITGQIDVPGTGSALYDQMLAEEYNGQIRLAVAEAEKIEKQITGQLSIDDVLSDWEDAKKENEKKREQEVRKRIVQHTGSLFDEFDEDTKAALIEQLEKAFRDAILKETDKGELDEEALGKKIRKEALRTVEYMTADGVIGEGMKDSADKGQDRDEYEDDYDYDETGKKSRRPADDEADEDESDIDDEPVEDEEENVRSRRRAADADDEEESDEDIADEENEQDESDDDDAGFDKESKKSDSGSKKRKRSSETDSIGVEAVRKALEEDEDTDRSGKKRFDNPSKTYATDSEGKRILSPEEEDLFKPFLNRRGARKQIIGALDNMSMAAYTGNCIVTGEEGTGTIDLAKRLIKYMQTTDSNFLGNQVAMVLGKSLNGKDLPALLSKINGGAIIIQSARGMKKSTVQKLISALENENLGVMAILEDTSEGMDKIVGTLPKLGEIFNARVDLQALDDKALVSYACEYALSQEHSIDEFAMLAIHTRIGEMQTSDHQVTVAEVRDLVDDAIFYADKKNPAHFFDIILHKRYDDDDMVILREKDFMHY